MVVAVAGVVMMVVLMEMVVGPVLSMWAPAWVVEQYKRWNPKFGVFLERALADDVRGERSNREILARASSLRHAPPW